MHRLGIQPIMIYFVLVVIGVPWYWQWLPSFAQIRWLGLPVWVITSLSASALVSLQTVWVLRQPWENEREGDHE